MKKKTHFSYYNRLADILSGYLFSYITGGALFLASCLQQIDSVSRISIHNNTPCLIFQLSESNISLIKLDPRSLKTPCLVSTN